jgi:hypothetical protein
MHGDVFPTEMHTRGKSSGSRDQRAIGCDGYRVQKADFLDSARQVDNITKIVAMPLAHNNVVDREGMRRRFTAIGFHYLLFINKIKNARRG